MPVSYRNFVQFRLDHSRLNFRPVRQKYTSAQSCLGLGMISSPDDRALGVAAILRPKDYRLGELTNAAGKLNDDRFLDALSLCLIVSLARFGFCVFDVIATEFCVHPSGWELHRGRRHKNRDDNLIGLAGRGNVDGERYEHHHD